jgi:hypothetical protein
MTMKRTIAFVVFCLLGTSGAALGDEARGVIKKIDVEKQEVVLQLRGKGVRGLMLTFAVDKDTQLTVGGHPAKLAEMEPGALARLSYETRDGHRVALGISATGNPRPRRRRRAMLIPSRARSRASR